MSQLMEVTDKQEMRDRFARMRKALIDGGQIPDVPSDKLTLEQAQQMIEAMHNVFFTDGAKCSAS
jgi:hypothetical protein